MLQENQLAHKKEKLKFIHLKKVFYLISSLENPIDWKLNLHPLISPSRLRRLRPFTSEAKIEKLGNRANLIAHGSGWNFSFLFLSTTPAESFRQADTFALASDELCMGNAPISLLLCL